MVGPGRLSNDDRRKIFPEIIIYTLHFSLCYDDLGVCALLSQYGQRDQNKKAIRWGFEIRICTLFEILPIRTFRSSFSLHPSAQHGHFE